MVGLFRYLYYRSCWWDNHVVKDSTYIILSSAISVSFFQVLNIKFLSDLVFYALLDRRDLVVQQDKIVGILIVSAVLVVNYFYYHKMASSISQGIKNLNIHKRRIWDAIIIIYMIITIVTTIGLANMIRNNI